MKDIAIYGAGGFGKEVACLIDRINKAAGEPRWRLIGFFDDGKAAGTQISHYGPVLGGMKEINAWPSQLDVVIAIAKPSAICAIIEKIRNPHIHFPNVIDPDFQLADAATFRMGHGNIIQAGCYFSCDVTIGNFNVFNGSVVIGHDSVIGNFNVIMPAVRLSGEVSLGEENLLGVNCAVLQQLRIGSRVHLAAGSVLMTKPKDGNVYIGVPAKLFRF